MNKKLAKFLASDKRPEGTMILPELYGFLFAVAASPEPAKPEEWMSVVFNAEDPNYKSDEKRAEIEIALMTAFDEVNEQVQQDEPQLPEWCEILDPPLENFGDESPLAYWADGFFDGYDWLSDVWDQRIDEALEEPLFSALMVLLYFSHRDEAREFCDKVANGQLSKQRLAETSVDNLPEAMATYARIGRTLAQVFANAKPFVREQVKLGRNDPCSCGSGKKYKKCCMNT